MSPGARRHGAHGEIGDGSASICVPLDAEPLGRAEASRAPDTGPTRTAPSPSRARRRARRRPPRRCRRRTTRAPSPARRAGASAAARSGDPRGCRRRRSSRIVARSCGWMSPTREAHDAAPLGRRRPVDAHVRRSPRSRSVASAHERALVLAHRVHPDAVEIVARRGETDRVGDVRRARLELVRQHVPRACARRRRTRSCRRRSGRAASPRAARAGRPGRRCPSARASCGR